MKKECNGSVRRCWVPSCDLSSSWNKKIKDYFFLCLLFERLSLPTIVTLLLCFTKVLRAVCFSFFTPLGLESLLTLFSRISCWRLLRFLSFVLRARFSAAVSSLGALSEDVDGEKTSSGASISAAGFDVGRADSIRRDGIFSIVIIVALGFWTISSTIMKREKYGTDLVRKEVSIAKSIQFTAYFIP